MEENMNNSGDVKYNNALTKEEILYTLKVVGTYLGIILVWAFTSRVYLNFGKHWITPAVCAMWILGSIATYVIAEQRETTIKETKYAILFYCLFLLAYRWVIQKVAPVTSAQMGAALDVTMPTAGGLAITGFLQNILSVISVTVPIGYAVWIGQKFKVFKGRNTKQQELEKLKGFKKNNRVR